MRAVVVIFSVLLGFGRGVAQEPAAIETLDDLTQAVDAIKATEDVAERQALVDALWNELSEAGRIPFIDGENVVFLYRGEARSVSWVGDWSWFQLTSRERGERIEGTDLWVALTSFPLDARLDYAIRLGGRQDVILDPANPRVLPGVFGGQVNELVMPEYVKPPATIRADSVPRGNVTDDMLIDSANLGYDIAYRVYTPAGYDALDNLNSIYVLDGEYYVQEQFGAVTVVLDNLIAQGVIEPAIAVFIDGRDPQYPALNRRMSQFLEVPSYADFIADELVPAVDAVYKTARDAGSRLLIGSSSGGIGVLYLAITLPDLFHNVAPLSPWLPEARQLFSMYEESDGLPLDFFVVSGLPEWDAGDLTPLLDLLDAEGYPYRFLEDAQAHNFPLWRDALDDVLLYFFPSSSLGD